MLRDPAILLAESVFEDDKSLLASLQKWITGLPGELQPTHFGAGERVRRTPQNLIADEERFRDFVARWSNSGFFLFGGKVTFQVDLLAGGGLNVGASARRGEKRLLRHADAVLAHNGDFGAAFGFACDWAEYAARNQFRIEGVDGGSSIGFVGRDIRRYAPGLYWLTYFSNAYAEARSIDVAVIERELHAQVTRAGQGHLVRLFKAPADWREHADRVRAFLHRETGFFSIDDVVVPRNLSRRDVLLGVGSPSKEWP